MSNLAVLIEAVKNGDEQGVLAGLRRDPSLLQDTDKTGSTLLHHAALSSSAAIVSLLLSRGADPASFNDFTQLPLHWAAAAGNLGTATVLVQRGGEVVGIDETCLDMPSLLCSG
jgi:ankyrin repeat protein